MTDTYAEYKERLNRWCSYTVRSVEDVIHYELKDLNWWKAALDKRTKAYKIITKAIEMKGK